MAATLFWIGLGVLGLTILAFRPILGMAALSIISLLYIISPSYPLAVPEPHTVLLTVISPEGKSTVEMLDGGTEDFPDYYFVVRSLSSKPVVAYLEAYGWGAIFNWRDSSHLEVSNVSLDPVYRRGLPTRAGGVSISYSDFK
jgi:hypothetical protein